MQRSRTRRTLCIHNPAYRNRKRRIHACSGLRIMLCTVTVFFLVCASFFIFGNFSASAHNAETASSAIYYRSILIHSGDTLWEIAEKYKGETYDSTEAYISNLKAINNLETNELEAGQYLIISCKD